MLEIMEFEFLILFFVRCVLFNHRLRLKLVKQRWVTMQVTQMMA